LVLSYAPEVGEDPTAIDPTIEVPLMMDTFEEPQLMT
jgi:hypothetical protein